MYRRTLPHDWGISPKDTMATGYRHSLDTPFPNLQILRLGNRVYGFWSGLLWALWLSYCISPYLGMK